jgi:hypothetical protein
MLLLFSFQEALRSIGHHKEVSPGEIRPTGGKGDERSVQASHRTGEKSFS